MRISRSTARAARRGLPPGPRAPRAAQTAALLRDPLGFLERCERRYGRVFRVKLIGFPRFVYVTDPALAREVYATDRTVGRASPGRKDFLEPLVGEKSLLCLEDEEWLRHRKLIGPAFHRRQVDGYADEIARMARETLRDLPTGEPVALRPWMQRITLEVILQLVFGVTDETRLARLRTLLPELIDAGASPLIWVAPSWLLERRLPGRLGRFVALREEVDALVYAEIAERRAAGTEGRTDVLSRLLDAHEDGERPLTDVELRDELITLLTAGHETTATALAWTFERLVRAPEALERLRDEDDEEYLRAVVKESLRARAVVIDTPRLLEGPIALGGYEIPAGWYVSPVIALVQRNGGGDEFRPERFLEDGAGREAWIPFGGGKRHCVGSHLALLEIEVIAREVVRAFELEAVDAAPEPAKLQHVTLVPGDLGTVRARARVPAALHR